MKKSVHVLYSGSVQGVGFRYTAREIASELGVRGWVKNLWDGRVEVEAEAEESVLVQFLDKISGSFPGIRKAEVSWEPPTDGYRDFSVRF
jgi:acylphosphatase